MATTNWEDVGIELDPAVEVAELRNRVLTLEAAIRQMEGRFSADRKLAQAATVRGVVFTSTDLGTLGDVTALQANTIDATYGNQERDQITSLTTTVNELLATLEAAGVITVV